jgi:hypothetical protein
VYHTVAPGMWLAVLVFRSADLLGGIRHLFELVRERQHLALRRRAALVAAAKSRGRRHRWRLAGRPGVPVRAREAVMLRRLSAT